ncbi:hypothetical protein ACFLYB_00160 [Chloroflexota bacterium]
MFTLKKLTIDLSYLHKKQMARGCVFACGDLLENGDKPKLNSIMDDKVSASVSIEKLLKLDIETVYPGHGKPFNAVALEKLL